MSSVRNRALALFAVLAIAVPAGSRANSMLGEEGATSANISVVIITGLTALGNSISTKFPVVDDNFDDTVPEVELAPGPYAYAPPAETGVPSKPNNVSITPVIGFQFGTPFGLQPTDRLTFDVSGEVSALTAADELGNPASLSADFIGELRFSIEPTLVPSDAIAGSIAADALRSLLPSAGETLLRLRIFEDDELAPPILEMESTATSGVPATSVDVRASHDYIVRLEYGAAAPYGVDPPFALDYGLSLVAVPEPGTSALLGAGLAALGLVRRLKAP